MLGSKRTIPLWRTKRPLLSLERALSSLRELGSKGMITAPALAMVRARSRLQLEAKKKGRFAEG